MFAKQRARDEWLWVATASLLLVLFSSLPYLVAYRAETPQALFCGAVFDRMDYAVHLGSMRQGWQGQWKYTFQFTSEAQAGAYVKQAYIFWGHVSRWLGVELPVGYQLGRLLFGLLASLGVYALSAQVFQRCVVRWSVWLLVMLASGLGWLQILLGWYPSPDISPVEFWLIDAYPLFGMLVFPHFSALLALLSGMLAAFLAWLERPAVWKLALVIVCGASLQLIQPFAPLVADLCIGSLLIFRWLQRRRVHAAEFIAGLLIALAQAPLLIYNLWIFNASEIFRQFASQNITASPPPVYYLLGFGLLWPLAGAGAWRLRRSILRRKFAPIPAAFLAWSLLALLMAYSPGQLQRRFIFGYTIPLGMLAGYGLQEMLLPWFSHQGKSFVWRSRKILAIMLAPALFLSSLYLVAGTGFVMAQRPAAFFDPPELVQAVEWIAAASAPGEVVLAAPRTSQLVVERTDLRVYVGHPIETLNYEDKLREASDFYAGRNGGDWLADSGIDWVVLGPEEAAYLGSRFILTDQAPLFQAGDVRAYHLR